jgi:hypothetical protein
MISFSSPTNKLYRFYLQNATNSSASISANVVSISIKPYRTNEVISISDAEVTDGAIAQFPRSE